MGFSMRCYKNNKGALLLAACLLLAPQWAVAAGIFVRTAETFVLENVYRLNASIDFRLNSTVTEALHNGVALPLTVEIEIARKRSYMWDETIATLSQQYFLAYEPLPRRYAATNIASGSTDYYSSLYDALDAIGSIKNLHLVNSDLLQRGSSYIGSLRSYLDIDSLPIALRMIAYANSNWRLGSEWYVWPIRD